MGRRTRETRWASFGLDLLGVILLCVMISGPVVFRFDTVVKQFLILALFVLLINYGLDIYRLLSHKPLSRWGGRGSAQFWGRRFLRW